MNTSGDKIDALLREQNHYVDDHGFTTRVLQELPRRRRNWLGPAVRLGSVAVGSGLALRWLPLKNLPPLDSFIWHSPDPVIMLPWVTVLVVGAALVWGAVSALRRED